MKREPLSVQRPVEHMEISILLFSVLRERIGSDRLTISLKQPASGIDLIEYLLEKHPSLVPYRELIRLAVNEEYVSESVELKDGDEVALITPVSGG